MKCNNNDTNGHLKRHLEAKISEAEEVIEKSLSQCEADEIFMSFNGGKDCTVLLHILQRVYKLKYGSDAPPLLCLYVRPNDPFPEIESFVTECKNLYPINLITFDSSLKLALKDLTVSKPQLKASFMGSRRTDPHCGKMEAIQMTDPGWPKLLRVNPLLDWDLSDIWDYIITNKVPYCSLYDQGYTSLGSRSNTVPNPHLKYITTDGQIKYHPAYMMKDYEYERDGRL
ncbi:FAD synthase-like [Ctenocephalides felis]|uniref:FAD synthase-like n=1 Tax=Ctenocephalides felis TaxID=7515 RepID=UPI000E6E4D39|nr:FAD synthase-like [Ctenocephalides felis]